MSSFYTELEVAGQTCPGMQCQYGFGQPAGERGRVCHGLLQCVLNGPAVMPEWNNFARMYELTVLLPDPDRLPAATCRRPRQAGAAAGAARGAQSRSTKPGTIHNALRAGQQLTHFST